MLAICGVFVIALLFVTQSQSCAWPFDEWYAHRQSCFSKRRLEPFWSIGWTLLLMSCSRCRFQSQCTFFYYLLPNAPRIKPWFRYCAHSSCSTTFSFFSLLSSASIALANKVRLRLIVFSLPSLYKMIHQLKALSDTLSWRATSLWLSPWSTTSLTAYVRNSSVNTSLNDVFSTCLHDWKIVNHGVCFSEFVHALSYLDIPLLRNL